jgi:hypothetical protein
MLDVYNKFTDQVEKRRIEKLEMMDEFEEWIIIQNHYFISLSVNYADVIAEDKPENQLYKDLISKVKLN